MKAALLNLARAEVEQHGTSSTPHGNDCCPWESPASPFKLTS